MKILNSQGQPILLNALEKRQADFWQKHVNALGYEIPITTLTTIMKKITEQKFFQIAPADYMPVRVGEGAWSTSLETYRSYALGGDFETGLLNTGASNARLAAADTGVDSVTVDVKNWAKTIGWSLFDLQHAAKSGNWDLVTAKEKSRKKNWDLGIQEVAFVGLATGGVEGLLNMTGVNNNTSTITKLIKDMTDAELSTMLKDILSAYRLNCEYTAWPTHFVIPEVDYLGLATPTSATYPLKSKLGLITESLQIMTRNPNFKVLPCAYGNATLWRSGSSTDIRYALYNGTEEETLRMDIPVDYTNTLANSIDNFQFQNVGYGQFTGVVPYRPKEILYFTH